MGYGFLFSISEWMQSALLLYGAIVVLIGVFLLGENAAIAAFALVSKGYIDIEIAIFYAFLGFIGADLFWYFVSKKILQKRYEKYFLKHTSLNKTQKLLLRLVDKYILLVLLFIKFLAGTRLLLIFYIVIKKHIPLRVYMFFDMISTAIFISVLFLIGWSLGKGISSALSIERTIVTIMSIIALVIVFYYVLPKIITMIVIYISRKQNKHIYPNDNGKF